MFHKWQDFILFYSCVMFRCSYAPHPEPFTCPWTPRWSLHLGYVSCAAVNHVVSLTPEKTKMNEQQNKTEADS